MPAPANNAGFIHLFQAVGFCFTWICARPVFLNAGFELIAWTVVWRPNSPFLVSIVRRLKVFGI